MVLQIPHCVMHVNSNNRAAPFIHYSRAVKVKNLVADIGGCIVFHFEKRACCIQLMSRWARDTLLLADPGRVVQW